MGSRPSAVARGLRSFECTVRRAIEGREQNLIVRQTLNLVRYTAIPTKCSFI